MRKNAIGGGGGGGGVQRNLGQPAQIDRRCDHRRKYFLTNKMLVVRGGSEFFLQSHAY